MQLMERVSLFSLRQPSTQGLRKERMVAIPAPLSIQRDQKDIGSLQRLQNLLAAWLSHDRVAQGGGELCEYRGLEEKRLDLRRLLLEHFLSQVIQDIALRAAQLAEQGVRRVMPAQGETH